MCLAGAVANVADSNSFNPKVPSTIPAGGKDFPRARKFNHIALCLGGHIKVWVPGATIARKNTSSAIMLLKERCGLLLQDYHNRGHA